ncbi:MAG: hypothetical protein QM775_02990 [Pirellulales bacterium]
MAEAARKSLNATIAGATEGRWPVDDDELSAVADALEQLVSETPQGVPQPVVAWAWEILETTGRLSLDSRLPIRIRGRLVTACNELLQRPVLAENAVAQQPTALGTSVAARATRPLPAAPLPDLAALFPPGPAIAPQPNVPAASVQSGNTATNAEAGPAPLPQSAANAAARVNPIRGPEDVSTIQQASLSQRPQLRDEPAAPVLPPPGYSARTAWALFAEVGSDAQGAAAHVELRRRGFTEAEIELGRHLTSPDAAERLHYAKRLPSLAGNSLKPWLLHLSGDTDAEVRQACLTIMATNADPAIQARIRELAYTDADETVRQTAERAAGRTSQRR